ncbi:uncharacterized protein V6R79_000793 [Siganus canaliculatus]
MSILPEGHQPLKWSACTPAHAAGTSQLQPVQQNLHLFSPPEPSPRFSQQGEEAAESSGQAKPASAPVQIPVRNQPQTTQSSSEDLKCGVCCRTFVRSSYIRLHIRLNKGQRPYHCKVCNKTFVKLDTFVNHCDKHLRQKRDKNKESKDRVVKPPLFVPLSRPPSPEPTATQPLSSEVNTRARAKAKSKAEA